MKLIVISENTLVELSRSEEALHRILEWSESYPLTTFHEPTDDECKKANEALVAIGLSVDIFSASMARHVVAGIGKIAREGLGEKT
jgi:hypothetical protein